ncbi:hypothetical protein HYH03_001969 [Edaphochlamys debaryana]|uniref:BTB domain-containing protein n=1 Tax=Edaphochlamys debaryana TaxID=47281 RepID=A0A836C5T6_9CHLO|nr:hypothetical protein HYH03_001969 [Edaphochlamys debaryana]|eukprot:KAG2500398.1 hypothetical protein HYH03_001969 [Edaphochlamys debaryana]
MPQRAGSIFCRGRGDVKRVTRIQLPAGWRAGAAEDAAGQAAAAGPAGEQPLQATTLPLRAASGIRGLACVPWGGPDGSLIVATANSLYRLPLGGGGEGAGGAAAAAPAAPVLLAGRDSPPSAGEAPAGDGRGEAARFKDISGLVVDKEGSILLTDVLGGMFGNGVTAVRQVTLHGEVTTLAFLDGKLHRPFILPNGYLALCKVTRTDLLVLDLGLKPAPLFPPTGPPRRTLHADMGALLDAQPDGTADLTLVVGGRRFPVHRAILIARCDFFRSQLEGGFADGAAAELTVPDADPAAFELLLRFVYTGAVDIPSALAPTVAELADRLLLPDLCSDAQAVVLSGVSADTVVGSLLWAERLGASFSGLLSSLKAWYLEHHEEVHRTAPGSLKRLAESPDLMAELLLSVTRSAKRQRTG